MILKGRTTYLILLSFLLIAATSTASFFLFRYFESKKDIANERRILLERNKTLFKDIRLNIERLPYAEEEAKENIKRSAILYHVSFSVFINGGIVPGRDGDPFIPEAEANYRQAIRQLITPIERFRSLSSYIVETPYHLYESVPEEIPVDGEIKEQSVVHKKENPGVSGAAKELKSVMADSERVIEQMIQEVDSQKRQHLSIQTLLLLIISAIVIAAVLFIIHLLNKRVLREIKELHSELSDLKGAFDEDERRVYGKYYLRLLFEQFNTFKDILPNLRQFIENLYEHNFDAEPSDLIKETPLYNNLTLLRNDLRAREEEEKKRRRREKRRQWAVEGRTEITNILQGAASISELTDRVIVGLVKYLGAAQGGIFLLKNPENEETPYLEMASAFAYDRKKFLKKIIPVGEGLLGMAALEKTTYWLKSIPKEYIEIESGLGEATPKSLIIVPLKAETEMPGVMEIAAFEQFEQYEADFIEDIAQSIGSSLRSVQIAEQTVKLLEESRKKSEELALQDAQMRERFEELRDAQKQAKKNEMEMSALVSVIDRSLIKCELNLRGIIKNANRRFFALTDYYADELKGKDFRMLLSESDQKVFEENLNKVKLGEIMPFSTEIKTKFDTTVWILMQMAPVRDEKDAVNQVLLIGNDITRQKEIEQKNKLLLQETLEKAEKLSNQDKEMQMNIDVLMKTQEELMKKEYEHKALLDAIQTNYITAELNAQKELTWINKIFKQRFKTAETENEQLSIYDLLPDENKESFDKIWHTASGKENYRNTLRFVGKDGEDIWLLFSLSVVKNQSNEFGKAVFIATDITLQKITEQKVTEQATALQEQEQLMEMNMQEMMEINEELEKQILYYREKEQKIINKFADENDKKYLNWFDDFLK